MKFVHHDPDLHPKLWRVATPSLTVLRMGASRLVTIRLWSRVGQREPQLQSAAIAFSYGEPARFEYLRNTGENAPETGEQFLIVLRHADHEPSLSRTISSLSI
jgi:hypothetical protein